MKSHLGAQIAEWREKMGLTEDQLGARYGITGPAVLKFEKGHVRPSLDLWLKMAGDRGVPEKTAVLLWIKNRLPSRYQSYIDVSEPDDSEDARTDSAVAPSATGEEDLELKKWEDDLGYFQAMKARLLTDGTYRDKYIAIRDKKIIDSDVDHFRLARRVNEQYPYQAVLIARVEPDERVAEIPSPELSL